ncbi:6-phosphofructokinase [Miltoncostaea marina]|uniref:6-phosphofructokinase n=1 Tax=Miltoncostaea marina TaxID=2843215 RepID=UPI001C3DCD53|nr:ATP-dependent 6-phosphofructokinase [Miltoncostaea marina]
MRIGMLTGGGDCPGLNAVIRAAVRVGLQHGHEHVGLHGGWRGLLQRDTQPLDRDVVGPILTRGGTILGSSRTNPFKDPDGGERCVRAFADLGLDALIAIGGEDTLGVARRLHDEHGLNVIGVPKTIDNDLSGTDYTFGFWTAVQIASDAIDRLHTTAESHDRVIVVEVMGRHAGWIALEAGTAGGAHVILIPEQRPDVAEVCRRVTERRERGRRYAIVVVSEGVVLGDEDAGGEVDEFGHVQLAKQSVGERLAELISERTGAEARPVVLGHVQRGGTPIAYDRVLATRYGAQAATLAAERRYGRMVALQGGRITDIPLSDAVSVLKTVPEDVYRATAQVIAGP